MFKKRLTNLLYIPIIASILSVLFFFFVPLNILPCKFNSFVSNESISSLCPGSIHMYTNYSVPIGTTLDTENYLVNMVLYALLLAVIITLISIIILCVFRICWFLITRLDIKKDEVKK
jgi:hypothetical protein